MLLHELVAENDPVRLFNELLGEVDWIRFEAMYKPGKRGQPHPSAIPRGRHLVWIVSMHPQ